MLMSWRSRLSGSVVVAALLGAAAAAPAGPWRTSGSIGVETRSFWESAAHEGQLDGVQASLTLAPEFRYTSEEREHRFVLAPYLRVDAEDDERTHFDLREAYWLRVGSDWELTLGARRVFWGVAESRHLVDVINQVDAVEDVDEEDRLGQPMLGLTLLRDWGTLDLYLMPAFRQRTASGRHGRLRPETPVDTKIDDWGDMSYALRWSHVIGDLDLGVHAFHGTDREPRYIPQADGTLGPWHDRIDQFGVDLQLTKGAWLWKLEALWRDRDGHAFEAAVGGFEWTKYQLGGSTLDLGLLLELHHDGRDPELAPPTLYDDDVFVGARLAFNDTQDTSILAGALIDPDTNATLLLVEAERRIAQSFKLEVELRIFADGADDPGVAALAEDDHLTVAWSWHF
jgi:hypothetical protein